MSKLVKVSTLAQHRSECPYITSQRTMRAIGRVGQSVHLAVDRFVTVGETIADSNPEIKADMYEACRDARAAGSSIERLCEITATDPLGYPPPDGPLGNRSAMIRAARALLSSVTRVLLLADIVIVNQLLVAKEKVVKSMGRLEPVANFTEFVKAFSDFGADMIELAYVTKDQQNNNKDERRKAQMSAARQILEKSAIMLLTSSKACLLNPECNNSRENRDTVFCQMRRAMDLIHYVIKDSILETSAVELKSPRGQLKSDWDSERVTAYTALCYFIRVMEKHRPFHDKMVHVDQSNNANFVDSRVSVGTNVKDTSNGNDRRRECASELMHVPKELFRSNSERDRQLVRHKRQSYANMDSEISANPTTRVEYINQLSIFSAASREHLIMALDKVLEKTQDFTDSAYTSHENRENILLLCDRCRLELNQCLRLAIRMEQYSNSTCDLDSAIDSVITAAQDLLQQLALAAASQAPEMNHVVELAVGLVNSFHTISIKQELDRLQECADIFHDYIEHILDVSKLLRHIALTESLQVQAKFAEINLRIYGPQVITAARALSLNPSSKVAKENLEVFVNMWLWLASEMISISKDVIELTQNRTKPDRLEYLSLPRPGKHGTTSKPLKPSRLDQEEQEKIAESGLEMKMLTSEMDAETQKWNEESEKDNDIVKRAKTMSAMAFSMYQFTKGEGTLRTTQDLFTQAEYFAEEANRLYKVVRQFSYQVPAGHNKKELLDHLDRVPTYVQTLQFTVKDPTVGKAATFVKVDHVIKETKNLMNVINKVVTTCFECANKFKLDFSGLSGRSTSGSSRDDDSGPGAVGDSKGSTTSNEGSM